MSDEKFTGLPIATTVAETDVFAYSQDAVGIPVSRKITTSQLRETLALGGGVGFDYFFTDTDEGVIADYKLMYPDDTGESESTVAQSITGPDILIKSFITQTTEPTFTILVSGVYNIHVHAAKTAGIADVFIYAKFYKRASGGSETLLATTESTSNLTGSSAGYVIHFSLLEDVTLLSTDRLVVKFYGTKVGAATDPTATLYLEGTNASRLEVKTILNSLDTRYAPALTGLFEANVTSGMQGFTGDDTAADIVFNDVKTNINGVYNNSTGVVTSPVESTWKFSYNVVLSGLLTGHTLLEAYIATTGENIFHYYLDPHTIVSANRYVVYGSTEVKLGAAETAKIVINVGDDNKVVNVDLNFSSKFSGHIVYIS